MAVRREDFVMRKGFTCVKDGLGEKTRRSLGFPRGWRGLTASDKGLLNRWLHAECSDLIEFHTDVPVGCVPEVDGREVSQFIRDQISHSHPLRIDACVLRSSGWKVIEVKADAGYKALGQVLCYGFWAPRCCGVLAEAELMVVTDHCQEALRPVYEAFGVGLGEVGRGFGEEEEEY